MYSVDEVTGKGSEKAPVPQEYSTLPSNMVVNGLINKWTQEDQALIWNLCAKGCSTAEFKLLLYTAAKYNFDPLLKEIWCYKVSDTEPAVIFVSRDGLRGKAQERGMLNGISFVEGIGEKPHFEDGEFTTKKDFYVEGTLYLNGWTHPIIHRVYYSEYAQTKWNNNKRVPNKMWSFETGKPVTMLKKVCEAQMYRSAVNIKGIYIPEEFKAEDGQLENKQEYILGLEKSVEEGDFSVTEGEIKALLHAYNEAGEDVYVVYRDLTGEELPKVLNNISRAAYTTLVQNCKEPKQENVSDMF